MGTRGIIALQKGDRIRYCSVMHIADHAGDIKCMGFKELEAAFEAMAVIDDIKPYSRKGQPLCYFHHFESNKSLKQWTAYSIADCLRSDLWKPGGRLLKPITVNGVKFKGGREHLAYDRAQSLIGGQKTGYLPFQDNFVGRVSFGAIGSFIRTEPVQTQADVINRHRPFFGCEWIWYYNLDTRQVIGWGGGDKKFDFVKTRADAYDSTYLKKTHSFTLSKQEIEDIYKKYILVE